MSSLDHPLEADPLLSPGQGSDGPQPPQQPKAGQACTACRKQKRRCDKALPSCALCARIGRDCDYTDAAPPPSSDDFAMLRQKVYDLEQRLLQFNARSAQDAGASSWAGRSRNIDGTRSQEVQTLVRGQGSDLPPFPALFFLDAHSFDDHHRSIPQHALASPPEVLAHLGSPADVQHIVARYFETVHTWLPMVSKKRLHVLLSKTRNEILADHALLLLCMRLLAEQILEVADNALYRTAKSNLSMLEDKGLLSLQLVQASVLISAYEVGHGIYPAAFLSVGHSARLGQALGLHSRKESPQILKAASTWTEQEEVRRVWWAVQVLDR